AIHRPPAAFPDRAHARHRDRPLAVARDEHRRHRGDRPRGPRRGAPAAVRDRRAARERTAARRRDALRAFRQLDARDACVAAAGDRRAPVVPGVVMKSWPAVFGQAQSRWQAAGWLLAAAFPVLALVVDKAASTTYAIFFLAGLWLLARGRAVRAGDAKWVLLAFAAYFAVGVLSYFLGEQTRLGEQLLGRDIRFLGALAVFLVLARLALPERLLAAGFIAGGFVTGAVAVAEVLMAGPAHRAGGETISIVFGHLSALLFARNLAIAPFRRTARGRPAVAAAFALVAVTLASTRGGRPAAFPGRAPGTPA